MRDAARVAGGGLHLAHAAPVQLVDQSFPMPRLPPVSGATEPLMVVMTTSRVW